MVSNKDGGEVRCRIPEMVMWRSSYSYRGRMLMVQLRLQSTMRGVLAGVTVVLSDVQLN